jgi:hypothetical protein
MSNNNTKLSRNVRIPDDKNKDRRDVELTFLKNLNEKYQQNDKTNGNEQGESITNEYGTPKRNRNRSRSSQRRTRTITNSIYSATTIDKNKNKYPVKSYRESQSSITK